MRRRRRMNNRPRFKGVKKSFKNNKSTYIIIVLICMIGLNIGSMAIRISKNNKTSSQTNIEGIAQEGKLNKAKMLFNNIFNKNNPDKIGMKEPEEMMERGHEEVEDFIIIDDIEEYENFIVVRDSSGKFNLEDIPEPVNVKKIKVDPAKPYILTYHTHATEGYQPLKMGENYTTDNNQNVTLIGEIFSKVLETESHKVTHNTIHHDRPSFNKSYSRSLNTIKSEMAKEENIKFLFDIHRDGVNVKANNQKEYDQKMEKAGERFSTTIDGKDVATFSLVVGPDSANYEENLNYAKYIKAVSDIAYPGLCTGIIIKKVGRFNQYLSDYSVLLEVGANVVTIEEAKETAKMLGEIFNLVISKIIL